MSDKENLPGATIEEVARAVRGMTETVEQLAVIIRSQDGINDGVRAELEQIREELAKMRGDVEDARLRGTRPRQTTLSEIENAPRASNSINAIAVAVGVKDGHQPKPLVSASENRWLTFAIALLVAVSTVINAITHH